MKTTSNIQKVLFAVVIATGLSFASSCKKDSATATTDSVTEADAVELTTDAIVPANAGFTTQVASSANVSKTVILSCGVEKDSTITKASVSGTVPSYNYSLKWAYILNCSTNQLSLNFSGASSYAGVNMTSNDNSTGVFVLSGILPTATAYTLNSTYTRNGSQTSKIGRNYSFTSTLVLQSTNVMIDKTSLAILSGTAAVTITGTSSSGSTFSFKGTVTFLGGNKATLVLNSGTSYNIQW